MKFYELVLSYVELIVFEIVIQKTRIRSNRISDISDTFLIRMVEIHCIIINYIGFRIYRMKISVYAIRYLRGLLFLPCPSRD